MLPIELVEDTVLILGDQNRSLYQCQVHTRDDHEGMSNAPALGWKISASANHVSLGCSDRSPP